MLKKIKELLPGLILAVMVAIVSKSFAIFVPELGAATIAIFLGIALGNTIFKQPNLSPGTKFSESKLLECSIFLLGGTITFQIISQLGWRALVFILFQMSLTIICAIMIGKKLGFSEGTYLLMASGNAVCGSSAVAATAPAIEATDEEKGIVITIINLMGTVLMLVLPVISWLLFQNDWLPSGALIGGTLQSVGQVVASASMVSSKVMETATIFKIMRIIFLVVVVFVFGRIHEKNKQQTNEISATKEKGRIGIPWYIIGFFITCSLSSLGLVPPVMENGMRMVSSWFEIIALAAIGLRLNFSVLLSQGKRFVYYGLSLGTIQIIGAILLIRLFF